MIVMCIIAIFPAKYHTKVEAVAAGGIYLNRSEPNRPI
jgi:hypothetical protein